MTPADPINWATLWTQSAQLVHLAMQEDISGGDVTTQAIFTEPKLVRGHILSRTPTVACGLPFAAALLQHIAPQAQCTAQHAEGHDLAAGDTLCTFAADVRAVLTVERLLLNFLMRLCGIAAASRRAVRCIPKGAAAQIFDTRKTMPGWRHLDKAAVRTGGASNHRMGLFDAVLIKDNHIAAAGSIAQAVVRCRAAAPRGMQVEVEIDSLGQLAEALVAGPEIILLDNFSDADLITAVRTTAGRAQLEASGGITWERLPALARTGVQRISMGALTHSVQPADLSLEITG